MSDHHTRSKDTPPPFLSSCHHASPSSNNFNVATSYHRWQQWPSEILPTTVAAAHGLAAHHHHQAQEKAVLEEPGAFLGIQLPPLWQSSKTLPVLSKDRLELLVAQVRLLHSAVNAVLHLHGLNSKTRHNEQLAAAKAQGARETVKQQAHDLELLDSEGPGAVWRDGDRHFL